MLAVVKTPHIEMSITGAGAKKAIAWLSRKFEVKIISADNADSVNIEDTDFWKDMERNKVGNHLAGARIKAGLTQKQLAEKIAIKQTMISDYETGRRRLTQNMAHRLAEVLNIRPSNLK
jgi:ribosome-binding protein aMBF1 (putative translation factor)